MESAACLWDVVSSMRTFYTFLLRVSMVALPRGALGLIPQPPSNRGMQRRVEGYLQEMAVADMRQRSCSFVKSLGSRSVCSNIYIYIYIYIYIFRSK